MYLVSPPLPFFPVGAVFFLPKPGGGDPEEEDAAAEHRTLSLCAKRQAPPPRVAAAARIMMERPTAPSPLPSNFDGSGAPGCIDYRFVCGKCGTGVDAKAVKAAEPLLQCVVVPLSGTSTID